MKRYHRCTVPRRLWSFALPWPAILAIVSLAAAQLQGSAVVLDVTSAGATANDAEDDAAAIQKAIEVSIAGETVFLPAGTFLVNRTLRARSGLKIQGAGREQTIIKFNAVTQTDFLDLSGSRNVELCHLTIEGNHSPHARHGITGHRGGGHFIHHLAIQNLASSNGPLAIHFTGDGGNSTNGVSDCVIADNIIRNIGLDSEWGGGIRLSWGSSRNQILRNLVDNTGRGGIFANDASCDLIIRSNIVSRSGRKAEKLAIEVWRDCDRVVIDDNQVDHWLSIGGSARVAARRNTIRPPSGDIAFIGLELIGQDLVVTDNVVDGGQQIGVSVSNNASNQWQYCAYNRIQSMVQWGAQLQGDNAGARMLYFYKNRFLTTQRGNPAAIYPGADGRGFRFNGNCQQVILDSNEICRNPAEGIELGGRRLDQISIVNTVINGNGSAAVTGNPGADLEWTNNTVMGNGKDVQLATRGFTVPPPTADFFYPSTIPAGQLVTFTNRSTAPGGAVAHALWDFGHGVPGNRLDGGHTYSHPGTYRVTLIVWDNHGRGAIKERSVLVR